MTTPDEQHQSILDAYALIRAHMAKDITGMTALINGRTIVSLLDVTLALVGKLAEDAETTPELFMAMWQAIGVADYAQRYAT